MRKAIIIGATGVVGQSILQACLRSEHYQQVICLSRKPLAVIQDKLECHTVDFEQMGMWQHLLAGDDLFSALGTSIAAAGSKHAQHMVDYTFQANAAKAASANGVSRVFLVSYPGASPTARSDYLRMKGELEQFVTGLGFEHSAFFRPLIPSDQRKDPNDTDITTEKLLNKLNQMTKRRSPKPLTGQALGVAMVHYAEHLARYGAPLPLNTLDTDAILNWL